MKPRAPTWTLAAALTAGLLVLPQAACDAVSERAAGNGLPLLSGSGSPAVAGVVATDTVTVETRRVLDLQDDRVGVDHIAPGGRRAAGTDWETGDVVLRDLDTDELRRLTEVSDPWGPESAFGMTSRISQGGNRVAFTWYDFADEQAHLRVATLDADPAQIEGLYSPPGGWPGPMDWAPDGETILVSEHTEEGTHELLLVPVDGGEATLLKSLGWSAPQGGGFSPDGHFVAFDFAPDPDIGVRDIHVVARDGQRGGPLISGPADDYFLGWAPDGHLLFLSDRGETRGVWRVAVEDGRAAGQPELVKPDVWRAAGNGFDDEGRFYYTLISGSTEVHVATVDLEAGRVVVPPATAVPREIAGTFDPAWSPDGRRLAYLAERTPWGGGVLSDRTVMIRSLETGEVQSHALRGQGRGESLYGWSADGRHLLLRASYDRGGPSFLRLDVQTGEMERFPLGDASASAGFVPLPDGERVVAWRRSPGSEDRLGQVVLVELESGEERVVFEFEGHVVGLRQVAPSPDGQKVAIVVLDEAWEAPSIRVHSLADGEGRVVLAEQKEIERVGNLTWTADGSALLYTPNREPGEDVPVWRIALRDEGAELREAAVLPVGTARLAPHPDGRRVAFQAGAPRWELWVMENIGPMAERATDRSP